MNMHSLNRLFLFIMTLALSFNVAAMEPAKGLLFKASSKNSSKKAVRGGTIHIIGEFQRGSLAPSVPTKSNVSIATSGIGRATSEDKRGTVKKDLIFDGHPIPDTEDVYFEGVSFEGCKIYPPFLDEKIIQWDKIQPIELNKNSFSKCDFTNADMRNIRIDNCFFDFSEFNKVNLSSAQLARADADGMRLSDMQFKSRGRAKIINSTFWNSNFVEADLNSVIFENVAFLNVDFTRTNLKHVIFRNCHFIEAKFIETFGTNVTFEGCAFNLITFDLCDFTFSKFIGNQFKADELGGGSKTIIKFTDFLGSNFGTAVQAEFLNKKGGLVYPGNKETYMAEIANEKEVRKALKLKKQEEQPAPESKKIIEKEITEVEISVQGAQGVTRQRSKVVRSYAPAPVNPQPYHVSPEPPLDPNILPVPANSNYVPAPVYNSPQPYQGNQYPYVEPANTNYVPAPAYIPQPYQENPYPYAAPAATNYGPTYGPAYGNQQYNQNVTANPYGQCYGQTYPQENKY